MVHLAASDVGPHGAASRARHDVRLLDSLRAGRVVGLLADRDLVGNGIEVEFFGEKTTLPQVRRSLPALRGTDHDLRDLPETSRPLPRCAATTTRLDTHRRMRQDVQRLTGEVAQSLEGLIRSAPEQCTCSSRTGRQTANDSADLRLLVPARLGDTTLRRQLARPCQLGPPAARVGRPLLELSVAVRSSPRLARRAASSASASLPSVEERVEPKVELGVAVVLG